MPAFIKEDHKIFENYVFDAPSEKESRRIKDWIEGHRRVCKESNRYFTFAGTTHFFLICQPSFQLGSMFAVQCGACEAKESVTDI